MTAAGIKARIVKDQDPIDQFAWFFTVDAYLPGQLTDGGQHRVPRGQGSNLLVVRQRFPCGLRNG